MCYILCLFSALGRRVHVLQIAIISSSTLSTKILCPTLSTKMGCPTLSTKMLCPILSTKILCPTFSKKILCSTLPTKYFILRCAQKYEVHVIIIRYYLLVGFCCCFLFSFWVCLLVCVSNHESHILNSLTPLQDTIRSLNRKFV